MTDDMTWPADRHQAFVDAIADTPNRIAEAAANDQRRALDASEGHTHEPSPYGITYHNAMVDDESEVATERHDPFADAGPMAQHPDVTDPVDVADEFAAETDAPFVTSEEHNRFVEFAKREHELYEQREALGRWLVAEARYQRDLALRDAHDSIVRSALRTIESYQRVNSDLALRLARAHAGATPHYVHQPDTTISTPGDFLAWLFSLDEAGRLATADRVLRQADEAGACFYEDHRGRISNLESEIELLRQRPVGAVLDVRNPVSESELNGLKQRWSAAHQQEQTEAR